MDTILQSLTLYYGLDWAAMILGLSGTYMITHQKRLGFLLNSIACLMGVIVAAMSDQMGYIVYNAIILMMLSKAFISWPRLQATKSVELASIYRSSLDI